MAERTVKVSLEEVRIAVGLTASLLKSLEKILAEAEEMEISVPYRLMDQTVEPVVLIPVKGTDGQTC